MDNELRKIAIENVRNQKLAGIISLSTGAVSLILFVMSLKTDFNDPIWIGATALVFFVGMYIAFQYEKKW